MRDNRRGRTNKGEQMRNNKRAKSEGEHIKRTDERKQLSRNR